MTYVHWIVRVLTAGIGIRFIHLSYQQNKKLTELELKLERIGVATTLICSARSTSSDKILGISRLGREFGW